jgi:hypothetical protein
VSNEYRDDIVAGVVEGVKAIGNTETTKSKWQRRTSMTIRVCTFIAALWGMFKITPEILQTSVNVSQLVPDVRGLKLDVKAVSNKLDYRITHMDSLIGSSRPVLNLGLRMDSNEKQRRLDVQAIKDLIISHTVNGRFGSN